MLSSPHHSRNAQTADDLLHRGYTLVMYRNEAGQTVAVAVPPGFYGEWVRSAVQDEVAKDHEVYAETPEQALRRLVERIA